MEWYERPYHGKMSKELVRKIRTDRLKSKLQSIIDAHKERMKFSEGLPEFDMDGCRIAWSQEMVNKFGVAKGVEASTSISSFLDDYDD